MILNACSSQRALRKPGDSLRAVEQLKHKIDGILQDSALYQTRTGLKVVSLRTGETLYSRNNQILFHPASNMKLLTTATALSRLGPNFKFKTALYADPGSLTDSTIAGNIYLKGFGNPDLVGNDLHWMIQQLKSRGITGITGDLVCDDSYMDDLYWGSGWMWDDASSWYWAPISALTVNDNCVTVTVKPGNRTGDSLIVQVEPPTAYVTIRNHAITIDSSDTLQRKAFKVEREWKQPANIITVEGGRFIGETPQRYIIDVVDAALYTGTLFRELLHEANIVLAGQVRKSQLPDSHLVLVEHLSPPLTAAVINTNKISDNLSAELLLKTIAAEIKGPPGTARKGISVIYEFMNQLGVDSTTYELADGSGVSRYNIITPDLLIELLKAMHEDFRIQAEFKTSLPIAGVDGTLEKRMINTAAENKLRAKTGTLSGVSALAGYTTTAEGEELAFAMIMEHFLVATSRIRKVQDRIGAAISAFRRIPETLSEVSINQ